MKVSIVAYPGTLFTSKHHYAVFMKGNTEVTSRLLMPVLIDAKSGDVTDSRVMPWYVNTLFLSQPLHFGNYGGMTLKIIWGVFDFLTIVVLITGVYLWIARRKSEKKHWKNLSKTKIMNKKIFKLWGMPVLLAVLSLYGLISALIGKGIWDILACAALIIPVLIIMKHYYKNLKK